LPELAAAAAWAVVIPLAAGVAAFVAGARHAFALALAGGAATLLAALAVAAEVWRVGPLPHRLGGWGAPLGIELRADGLSALMLLMTGVVGIVITAYARGYFGGRNPGAAGEGFWPLWLILWGGLNALYLSADVFNLYVTLEVMGLASVVLVALAGGTEALAAALRYLLVSIVGSLAYLLGVALLYGEFGTLSLAGLAERATATPGLRLAAGLVLAGLAMKTALYPLHFWLPPAHANAPAPVSALLSGLVVKASFYIILRLWTEVLPREAREEIAQLLGVLGAAAIVFGSMAALAQERLKLLVAYSTVAQLGYLFLLFPLAATAAYHGVVMHMLSHACAKAALFLAAGNVLLVLGRDELAGVRAATRALPLSTVAFALGGLSLIGLPPTGGFLAKWLLLTAALEAGAWWWAAVIVAGSLLAAAYVFRVLAHCFRRAGPGDHLDEARIARAPWLMELAPFVLAVLALLLGLEAGGLLALLEAAGGRP
jgi:formate hydrogenlyase subunit 3/multisubunit Na+/H+ antiporter MnhD subunit